MTGGPGGRCAGVAAPVIIVPDVAGSLVDSNSRHALAWYRAFRSLGETLPVGRIHRLIGMGGDQLVWPRARPVRSA